MKRLRERLFGSASQIEIFLTFLFIILITAIAMSFWVGMKSSSLQGPITREEILITLLIVIVSLKK